MDFKTTQSRFQVLLLASAIALVTACGGGSSSGNSSDNNGDNNSDNNNESVTDETVSGTESSTDEGSSEGLSAHSTAPNTVQSTGIGDVFVEKNNLTLYSFDNDEANISHCEGGCLSSWPIVEASVSAEASGDFGIIERDDGLKQWTWRSMPLYTFVGDSVAGDTTGDGIGGTWHVVRPDAVKSIASSLGDIVGASGHVDVGGVITDKDGFALYTFTADSLNTPTCFDSCATSWPPLLADGGSSPKAPFSIVERTQDSSKQWALNGKPLYFFAGDSVEGAVGGEGVGDSWFVARVAPVRSANGVLVAEGSIADGDGGSLTDKGGFTLYTFDEDSANVSSCDESCLAAWPALWANSDDTEFGDYTIIDTLNGKKMWAYKTQPLYFFSGDQAAGDTNGVYGTWHTAAP